jgi:hypothetical protein
MRLRSIVSNMLVRLLLPTFLFAAVSVAPAQTAPSTVNFRLQAGCCDSGSPNGITTGDFNEDGRVDVAVIDEGTNSIFVVKNDGAFQFSIASIIERESDLAAFPIAIVAGTFDGDTHQDLAVASQFGHRIDIYLGRGDGTFITSDGFEETGTTTIPIAGVPISMIGANLRNDGRTQLVVTECAAVNVQPCTLDVFQSNSAGIFEAAQRIALPGVPGSFNTIPQDSFNMITSDDFDLDNKPDIAIGVGNKVMVFRNTSAFDGNASAHLTLQTTVKSPNGGLISALTSGHFNAGAAPDLLFEVFNPGKDPSLPNTQYVFLNHGNGTFFLKQVITGQHSGHNLAVSDLNGDFIQDLIVMGAKGVDYALGRGDGTFGAFQHISDPSLLGNNTAIAIRDLNRDSRHDLIFTTFGLPPSNGSFAGFMLNANAAPNCPAPGSQAVSIAVCSITPATNAITVKASGNSPNGVKRLELWVDGKKLTQAFNDQINARVSVAAGTRRVTIVAVDLYDAIVKKTMTVTVP